MTLLQSLQALKKVLQKRSKCYKVMFMISQLCPVLRYFKGIVSFHFAGSHLVMNREVKDQTELKWTKTLLPSQLF